MTQRDRDRLVVLKKAQKRLITQVQAAGELQVSERQVRRLLGKLKGHGDRGVIHGLRGRASNRKVSEADREKAVRILSQQDIGTSGQLCQRVSAEETWSEDRREALRQIMIANGLWRSRRQKVEAIHQWRQRRSARGELVQWDTSTHDWLEGASHNLSDPHDRRCQQRLNGALRSQRLHGREHANGGELREEERASAGLLHGQGEPFSGDGQNVAAYDGGRARSEGHAADADWASLRELGIAWIPAHSAQAKGRVERSFETAQDRLVKGMRIAGVRTLEEANRYLEEEFIPWWNQHLTVAPANPTDAHRPLGGARSGFGVQPCGDAAGGQRLHDSVRWEGLSDCPRRHRSGLARVQRTCGDEAGRYDGGAVPREGAGGGGLHPQAEGNDEERASTACAQEAQEIGRRTLWSDRSKEKFAGVGSRANRVSQNLHKERRAKAARRSPRLIYPKTAARGLHQCRSAQKNQNPQNGHLWPGLTGGLAPSASKPAPSSGFGSAPGSATSPEHRILHKPAPQFRPSKPDILNGEDRTFLLGVDSKRRNQGARPKMGEFDIGSVFGLDLTALYAVRYEAWPSLRKSPPAWANSLTNWPTPNPCVGAHYPSA